MSTNAKFFYQVDRKDIDDIGLMPIWETPTNGKYACKIAHCHMNDLMFFVDESLVEVNVDDFGPVSIGFTEETIGVVVIIKPTGSVKVELLSLDNDRGQIASSRRAGNAKLLEARMSEFYVTTDDTTDDWIIKASHLPEENLPLYVNRLARRIPRSKMSNNIDIDEIVDKVYNQYRYAVDSYYLFDVKEEIKEAYNNTSKVRLIDYAQVYSKASTMFDVMAREMNDEAI